MPTLFLSFWDLSLSNLPTGALTNLEISAAEAASFVSAARSRAGLLCGAANDLAAPYHRRAFDKHVHLCGELANLGIELSIEDFFAPDYCRPLQMARVGRDQHMMVVDCNYTLDFEQHIANPDAPSSNSKSQQTRSSSTCCNCASLRSDSGACGAPPTTGDIARNAHGNCLQFGARHD